MALYLMPAPNDPLTMFGISLANEKQETVQGRGYIVSQLKQTKLQVYNMGRFRL
jgi:hypothetical protein